jgi:hypothetical protein
MKQIFILLTILLSACGGGSDGTSSNNSIPGPAPMPSQTAMIQTAVVNAAIKVMAYQNENSVSHSFNVAVADLNGDGLEDVVVTGWAVMPAGWSGVRNANVPVKILLQQENGSLIDRTDALLGSNNMIAGAQRILIEDFDNDGRPDIFVGGFQDVPSRSAASVMFWNNGSTWARQDFTESVWAHAACAGDLRGTGRKDIVMGASGNSPNTIYLNNGSRSFTLNRSPISTPITGTPISSAGTCSIVKDSATGNVGIITTNVGLEGNSSAYVRVFDSNMNYITSRALPGSEEVGNANLTHDIVSVVIVDIDKDGDQDVILLDNGNYKVTTPNGKFTVLVNQGNFNFVDQTSKYFPSQTNDYAFAMYSRVVDVGSKISLIVGDGRAALSAILWKQDTVPFSKTSTDLSMQYLTLYKTRNNSYKVLVYENLILGQFNFYTKDL